MTPDGRGRSIRDMHAPLRSFTVAVLVAVAACVAAAPAGAAKTKVAHFEVTLKGSQKMTWHYHRPSTGSCDASEDAEGQAYIQYTTPSDGPIRLTAMQAGKASPLYRLYKGRPALLPKTGRLDGGALLTMTATHDVGGVDPSCPEDGGGGTEQPIGCGTTAGDHALALEFRKKNRLTVSGTSDGWAGPRGRTEGFLSTAFDNCPHWLGGPTGSDMLHVSEGDIGAIDEAFAEKQLFDKKRKRIVARADVGQCFDADGEIACGGPAPRPFSGDIVTRWKLTLKRVKG
jgi:hypothetical protein